MVKKSGKAVQRGKNGQVLVVYFSRTQGVYGGDLKLGNTARVAQREQDSNARPAIKKAWPDVKKYDTIFIGSPIWWGEYPMIVRTFIDNEKLNGKTVIPFTTSECSGLGNTAEILRKAYPKEKVITGFSAGGNDVKNNPQAVQKPVNSWLTRLGD